MAMTVEIPEFCFTPEDAAAFKKQGERRAKKGGPEYRKFKICGYEVALPPFSFSGLKRDVFSPGGVVLQVYTRRGTCVGAFNDLEGAQRLMFQRGRNAGHKMHVCVDYSPPLPYVGMARVCIARIGRQLAQTLYVPSAEKAVDASEVNQ